jgi:hypothetical protein
VRARRLWPSESGRERQRRELSLQLAHTRGEVQGRCCVVYTQHVWDWILKVKRRTTHLVLQSFVRSASAGGGASKVRSPPLVARHKGALLTTPEPGAEADPFSSEKTGGFGGHFPGECVEIPSPKAGSELVRPTQLLPASFPEGVLASESICLVNLRASSVVGVDTPAMAYTPPSPAQPTTPRWHTSSDFETPLTQNVLQSQRDSDSVFVDMTQVTQLQGPHVHSDRHTHTHLHSTCGELSIRRDSIVVSRAVSTESGQQRQRRVRSRAGPRNGAWASVATLFPNIETHHTIVISS